MAVVIRGYFVPRRFLLHALLVLVILVEGGFLLSRHFSSQSPAPATPGPTATMPQATTPAETPTTTTSGIPTNTIPGTTSPTGTTPASPPAPTATVP